MEEKIENLEKRIIELEKTQVILSENLLITTRQLEEVVQILLQIKKK